MHSQALYDYTMLSVRMTITACLVYNDTTHYLYEWHVQFVYIAGGVYKIQLLLLFVNWETVIDLCQSTLFYIQNSLQPILRLVKTSSYS